MQRQSSSGPDDLLNAVVVPFTTQQVSRLQEGLLYALCVPLLEASNDEMNQDKRLDQAYEEHPLTQPNVIIAVGEDYQISEEGTYYRCTYRDGSSVVYPRQVIQADFVVEVASFNQWQNPVTLPLLFCRYFLPVEGIRKVRINHIRQDEEFMELGIVEPAETLVCCHKFCGYKPIPGYDGPEQEPICCQKPEKDYSFEVAFRQQFSALYGLGSLCRNDYVLWIYIEPPTGLP